MAEIIARDTGMALPDRPIVVTGGQRVRLWKDLPARLSPGATLMRPLGDATLEDLHHHFDRLVAFYRPRVLVVVPSYGDLHLRDEKTPEDFQLALQKLLELDASYETTNWRVILAPLQTPLHPEDHERIHRMTQYSHHLTRALPRAVIVDPNPFLARADGRPNPAYFSVDGVNLNEEGYARVSLLLSEALRNQGIL